MINQIFNEEMRTSKKLKIKFQKKQGMNDSQIIMQHLAESIARESQKLDPTPNPLIHNQRLQNEFLQRSRLSSVDKDWLQNDRSLAQSNYFTPGDRVTFGNAERERSYDRFQSNSSIQTISSSQLFSIPTKVTQLLQQYPEYLKILKDDIENQKQKIEIDCNRLKDILIDEIDNKKQELLILLDQIAENYENNYSILQNMISEFKQSFLQVPTALNRSIPVNIKEISIFHYNNDENYTKVKEEKCLIKQRLSNIDTELMKRTLTFMAEDMDSQIVHKPGYRHTETLQLKYDQFQQQLQQLVNKQLQELNYVLELAPQYNYQNILLLPKVETVIANNRQNAIGGDRDFQELENLKTLIQNKLKQQKFNMNTSLGLGQSMKNFIFQLDKKFPTKNPLLSIQAITNELIATGSRNGLVQIWDLQKQAELFSFQTRQPVTCMRIFKGHQGDFNVSLRASTLGLDLKEQSYLITGNIDIKIWDLKTGSQIKQLKGIGGVITSLLCLLDNHTIISGQDDGKLVFWNAYSGMAMKKLQDHRDSVNCLTLTKEGKLISAGSDKQIIIYQIHYVRSQIYTRKVFGDALKQTIINDDCQIYSMQSSMIDENLLITGGSDYKIKIWNLKIQKADKEIVGHKCPVGDLVMLENPLDVEKEKMFAIVSAATGDDVLRISTSISPLNSGVYINEKIVNEYGATCGPLLQLLQDQNGLKLLVVNQDEGNQSFIILKLQ